MSHSKYYEYTYKIIGDKLFKVENCRATGGFLHAIDRKETEERNPHLWGYSLDVIQEWSDTHPIAITNTRVARFFKLIKGTEFEKAFDVQKISRLISLKSYNNEWWTEESEEVSGANDE